MTLSVVIVNYNVKYFLDQCLESVFHSDLQISPTEDISLEVFVVDNASVDGSVSLVKDRFPQVHLIANNENTGFAKANNQALRLCTGDYILLLNPDTIVEKDTFRKCVEFYATHPDCGGLTVKMINGEGKYLKESKRGFPTPAAAFYKMSGLIRLFPHSRRFAAYYMGHLDDDETNAIDILPGAYLMLSRDALEKVGLLDESYFMYGEDIDFSWRIKLAGFENYYLPAARIIHYKGESTKHGSMNYVYTFYNAMSIFVKHYFSGKNARLFNLLLRIAIWVRAVLAWAKRLLQAAALPVAEFAVAYAGFVGIKHLWSTYWAENVNYYPPEYTWVFIPFYILLLMLGSWLYGGYVKPVKLGRMVKGMAVGCLLLLVYYSLLNENLRFSRALLLMGCGWTILSSVGIRLLLGLLHVPGFGPYHGGQHSCIVVGGDDETARVRQLYESLGNARPVELSHKGLDATKLNETINYYKADEVIFCSKDLSISHIIDLISQPAPRQGRRGQVDFKIVPTDSDFIIGSNGTSAEDIYAEEIHTIASPLNRRNKRMLDMAVSVILLLLSPILVWFQSDKKNYFIHSWQVLTGKKTWVGTTTGATRKGVFGPEDGLPHKAKSVDQSIIKRLHLRYLRNYKLSTDIQIILKNLQKI